MKKLPLMLLLLAGVALVPSCRKAYSCTCTQKTIEKDKVPVKETYATSSESGTAMRKKKMQENCSNRETVSETTEIRRETTCEFKWN